MRGKINIKKFLLVITLALVFTFNISSVLFTKNVYYAEESSNKDTSSTTLDISRIKQTTYEAISSGYNATETSVAPAELWKDGASKTHQAFNDIILKTLGVKTINDVTVKMIVEDIKTLDLSGQKLNDMPEMLFYMASLEDLNLSNNDFTVFDFSDSYLFSLKKINISKNSKLIGINTHDLGFLDELDVSDCNIKTKSIVSISQTLSILNLSGNKIEAFKISNIEGLKELIISDGNLRYLEVINCPELGNINVKTNALSAVKFEGLVKLVNLDLSNNLLTTVPNVSMAANLSTGNFDISNNQITSLPDYLDSIGLNKENIKLSNNLLNPESYSQQNSLIIKENTKITISKHFDKNELLEKLSPYMAISEQGNQSNVKPVSPNFSLKPLLEDNEDTKGIEAAGITKDFVASISIRLATAKEPDGLQTSNTTATISSIDFKKDGDAGVKIEGDAFKFSVNASSESKAESSLEKSSSSSDKSSSASSSSSSAAATSTGQKLPETGVSNMPRAIIIILIFTLLATIIKSLIDLGVKKT